VATAEPTGHPRATRPDTDRETRIRVNGIEMTTSSGYEPFEAGATVMAAPIGPRGGTSAVTAAPLRRSASLARHRHPGDRGGAIVELALILPLLLVLVFGLIEFGRAYNAQITLTHATREGVRTLAITRDGAAAIEATKSAATSLDTSQLSVSPSDCTPGDPASVTSSYPFAYSIAFFGSGTIDMNSTAVMRCGG
jgi:hypothetical protein